MYNVLIWEIINLIKNFNINSSYATPNKTSLIFGYEKKKDTVYLWPILQCSRRILQKKSEETTGS